MYVFGHTFNGNVHGRGRDGRGVELKCYIHTDIQTEVQTYINTDPPTKRVLEELSLLKRNMPAKTEFPSLL